MASATFTTNENDKDDMEYNMEHPKRGKALILNHKKYDTRLKLTERKGTDVDGKNLQDTLSEMGFEVTIYDDFTHDQISKKLEEVAREDHSEEDCLLVAVMTHGADGGVIYAYDKPYEVEELWGNFTARKCPTLAQKPKIFLIQACRGGKANPAVKTGIQKDASCSDSMMLKIPNYCDFVIMFSTMPSFVSMRNLKRGSWMIQSFCKVFGKKNYAEDFLSLLTQTTQRITTDFDCEDEGEAYKQTSCVNSMLTKKIFFRPKSADGTSSPHKRNTKKQKRTFQEVDGCE